MGVAAGAREEALIGLDNRRIVEVRGGTMRWLRGC
jgi:hypothetical protein